MEQGVNEWDRQCRAMEASRVSRLERARRAFLVPTRQVAQALHAQRKKRDDEAPE